MKKQARDFGAATGFRTLVPDLYRGELGVNAEEAHHLMDNLDWQGAVADIAAAAKYLKDTGCPTVAVMGFCMGGALSLAAGVHSADIDKVVCFYGTPPDALADVTTISKPVQAHFGDEDSHAGFSDPAAVAALREKLEASGADFTIHTYAGAGHGFMNDTEFFQNLGKELGRPEFSKEVYDTAFARVVDFVKAE